MIAKIINDFKDLKQYKFSKKIKKLWTIVYVFFGSLLLLDFYSAFFGDGLSMDQRISVLSFELPVVFISVIIVTLKNLLPNKKTSR